RAAGNGYQAALALQSLGWADFWLGEATAGLAAGQEAVELARQVGDPVLLYQCLVTHGLNVMDDFALCESIYEEAVGLARRSGDRMYLAAAYNNFGCALLAHRQWARA